VYASAPLALTTAGRGGVALNGVGVRAEMGGVGSREMVPRGESGWVSASEKCWGDNFPGWGGAVLGDARVWDGKMVEGGG